MMVFAATILLTFSNSSGVVASAANSHNDKFLNTPYEGSKHTLYFKIVFIDVLSE